MSQVAPYLLKSKGERGAYLACFFDDLEVFMGFRVLSENILGFC